MFRFNFKIDSTDGDENIEGNSGAEEGNSGAEELESQIELKPVNLHKIKLHLITDDHVMNSSYTKVDKIKERLWKDKRKLKYVSSDEVNHSIKDISPTSQGHSDLIPSVYEGGFKIWECTWDLIEHIKSKHISFNDKRVLDLGCGSGVAGIVASIEGASHVMFQDYNEEVLEEWTIPNVILNLEEEENDSECNLRQLNSKCSFYSGDWEDFASNSDLQMEEVDLILTSETIYNEKNYDKLIKIFNRYLKPSGVVLLAAKTYYFGVGGGILAFRELLNKNGFQVSSVLSHTEGVQREILIINNKLK